MDLSTISAISGLLMTGIVLLGAIIGGFYLVKSGVSKQKDDAQQRTMTVMQTELSILRDRVADAEKENTRLQSLIDTIYSALEARGMVITIRGKMVHIKDSTGTATVQIDSEQSEASH